ncbi:MULTISPECIES: hypothetical protein [unclassified Caballeronia]|uniref:hypothetical protein n=1 Tax=unclassified Caballeronia TaxID=2646786 RepID=UPI0028583253|nr:MULTISPECIES: hypothetical protein [unclassified Caballeronia]MDR5739180.1 hypothetical protein [Caballeronia sp. LZ016]MDR5807668.1 hypothetical protein [Caballeronia sp. LZ019]
MPSITKRAQLRDISEVVTFGRSPTTMFNATIEGKRYFSLTVPGRPRLQSGMEVTSVLRDPDDWYSIIGWLDHKTGDIIGVPSPAVALLALAACGMPALICLLAVLRGPEQQGVWPLTAMLTIASLWRFDRWRKARTLYRLLNRTIDH